MLPKVHLLTLLLHLTLHCTSPIYGFSRTSTQHRNVAGQIQGGTFLRLNTPYFLPITRLHAEASSEKTSTAPVLNGKRVLPQKVLMGGLKGHANVPGVFALLNKDYKRGAEGWENCEHIGVSMDLEATLTKMFDEFPTQAAHIRALSFAIPVEGAMQSIADDWRVEAIQAGGKINVDPVAAVMETPFDDDNDEDDFDEDDLSFMEMTAEAMAMARAPPPNSISIEKAAEGDEIVSPFEMPKPATITTSSDEKIVFNKENVDMVLDEVRPYLISDGGNVSVERVDEATRNVYLKLEGACGSCPSSTVTMQMGIERVLKEKFENLGEVLRVEEVDSKPKELSFEMVAVEVNRISPAIIAMGGSVEIVSVDGESGIVVLKFRGAQKVRLGLELAIRDIGFVKEVKFVE